MMPHSPNKGQNGFGPGEGGLDKRRPSAGESRHGTKLGTVSGVYVPVFLSIMSILMFLRFGLILGQIGFVGMLGLLLVAYCIDFLTILSLSAIASNGEVKGGGAYYLISRSLGPEFGGSIGMLFYLAQALNTALNIVGLIDCIRLSLGPSFPHGYWVGYGFQTAALIVCTILCFLGSATFSRASNGLLFILGIAIISIPISAMFKTPFQDDDSGINFTGLSFTTLANNFLPHAESPQFKGLDTFRDLFGILFPATSGIFAGASMSGDLKNPSQSIPQGTLWAMLTTFITYFVVILSLAASTTHDSFLANPNAISLTNLSQTVILAGECAVTFFSALMGLIGAAKLFQAFARDQLLPGLAVFGRGTKHGDDPIPAILLTYVIAQIALFADLNQIATFISMGYQMTFFVMNLACFLLKIGSAPNFRPSFKFFTWETAFAAGLLSAAAMFFIDETYAAIAICVLIVLFLLIHYLSPPKSWGDVSQNLIYHQVRKYLLRLKPEHIKFWRPQIILLVNDPRRQTRLIQFCNSLKKGSLYILGHVILTDDFNSGVHEAKLQQQAWSNYILESSKIKAFVQLTMSPTIDWGVRNLILSAGLGGMRPNIAVLGFYNMSDLRRSNMNIRVPDVPTPPAVQMRRPPKSSGKLPSRIRGDTSARLLEGSLPTDVIRTEEMISPTQYLTILEDLALRYRLNVAVGHGFQNLETPRQDGRNTKRFIDLWPIQMSAAVTTEGKSILTTNFDTYTLILQLGHILHSVQAWKQVYTPRVMVFVEYHYEVAEEQARVKALLEKLRIDAEVKVFCLASGSLNSYELIIHGISNDMDWEIIVNEALGNQEWWNDLHILRGQPDTMTTNEGIDHLAHIIDSTSGRPGVYNPHEQNPERRRASMVDIPVIPKRPAIDMLSRMGVNMAIHTHHLNDEVLEDSNSDDESESDGPTESYSDEETGNKIYPHGGIDRAEVKQPLLPVTTRIRAQTLQGFSSEETSHRWKHNHQTRIASPLANVSYGTISPTQRGNESSVSQDTRPGPEEHLERFPTLTGLDDLEPSHSPTHSRSASQSRRSTQDTIRPPRTDPTTPTWPTLSRQSSTVRFSSRPVPETRITSEAEGSKIGFALPDSETAPLKVDQSTLSRQSSLGKFSSQAMPKARQTADDGVGKMIGSSELFVDHPHSTVGSRNLSHQDLQVSGRYHGERLLQNLESYTLDGHRGVDEDERSSMHSMQGVELSFNQLPGRAQHLILNELMRQHSKETAVLLTTLPIPSEGTSLDDASSVQYLSDVELLCNELPPTLMVLSNSMTVTVNL